MVLNKGQAGSGENTAQSSMFLVEIPTSMNAVMKLEKSVKSVKDGDMEMYRVSITPTSTSMKVLVMASFAWGSDNPNGACTAQRGISAA